VSILISFQTISLLFDLRLQKVYNHRIAPSLITASSFGSVVKIARMAGAVPIAGRRTLHSQRAV
jgi:hypothetical protein